MHSLCWKSVQSSRKELIWTLAQAQVAVTLIFDLKIFSLKQKPQRTMTTRRTRIQMTAAVRRVGWVCWPGLQQARFLSVRPLWASFMTAKTAEGRALWVKTQQTQVKKNVDSNVASLIMLKENADKWFYCTNSPAFPIFPGSQTVFQTIIVFFNGWAGSSAWAFVWDYVIDSRLNIHSFLIVTSGCM